MKVLLAAERNPDFGETRAMPKPRWKKVKTIWQAVGACRLFITKHELGGGNWTGGEIRDDSDTIIASVSYNGRVWQPDATNAIDALRQCKVALTYWPDWKDSMAPKLLSLIDEALSGQEITP